MKAGMILSLSSNQTVHILLKNVYAISLNPQKVHGSDVYTYRQPLHMKEAEGSSFLALESSAHLSVSGGH